MSVPSSHFVEAGQGETIVLLHGSASTGAFWRAAAKALQPLHRTVTPDLIGYGSSPPWAAGAAYSVGSEIHALEALLPCCGEQFHLVGHSYGGVIALMMATANPARVRSLTLVEPVFFAALRDDADRDAYRDFCALRDRFLSGLERDGAATAMRGFIDFWAGDGTWDQMPPAMLAGMLGIADRLRLDWQAAFAVEADPVQLAALGPRTLLLCGDQSPKPMRRLMQTIHRLMPGSNLVTIPGAGHLLPLTHAAELQRHLLDHLHAEAGRRPA